MIFKSHKAAGAEVVLVFGGAVGLGFFLVGQALAIGTVEVLGGAGLHGAVGAAGEGHALADALVFGAVGEAQGAASTRTPAALSAYRTSSRLDGAALLHLKREGRVNCGRRCTLRIGTNGVRPHFPAFPIGFVRSQDKSKRVKAARGKKADDKR